jgi:hypothetical protein
MLGFFTVVVMLAIGYAYLAEGLFTAFVMCCNVLGAGFVAMNFWEPLADIFDPMFEGTFLAGYEDFFCMMFLFLLTLLVLRTLTNALEPTFIDFPEVLQRGGGVLFGLITGYLVCGFLVTAMQTLPWHENFMGFEPRFDEGSGAVRRVLPPDRVWLALMHRAGAVAFSTGDDSFDSGGSFELRYGRYRRYGEDTKQPPPYSYFGEFDQQLHRK